MAECGGARPEGTTNGFPFATHVHLLSKLRLLDNFIEILLGFENLGSVHRFRELLENLNASPIRATRRDRTFAREYAVLARKHYQNRSIFGDVPFIRKQVTCGDRAGTREGM